MSRPTISILRRCARTGSRTNMSHLCECGCGQQTMLVQHTVKKRNRVKGQPNRFLHGHSAAYALSHHTVKHGLSRCGQVDKRYYMWKGSHKRAKEQGSFWNLQLEDVPLIPDFCPVLGIPLDKESKRRGPNSPSLDRVIPVLGYTPGNVCVISWRANDLKKDASVEELEAVVKYIRRHIAHEQDS